MRNNNIIKKINNSRFMIDLRNFIRRFFCIISFLIGAKAFTYKMPYFIVLGFMLLNISLLLFSYLDKIMSKINIKLTIGQKWFIGVSSFLTAAYSISVDCKEYYRSFISIALIIIIWILTIVYCKRKDRKLNK